MHKILLLTVSFIFFSCENNEDKLIGHWHSISSNGYYWTLDVTDSTTQVNKYNLNNPDQEFERIFNYKGEETIFFDYKNDKDFMIKNDTLILNNLKFLRVKEKYHLNDHFPSSLVHLNLPKSTQYSIPSLPYRKSQLVDIYVGPSKDARQGELINTDSTRFQIRDILTTEYSDLEMFARQEDDKLPEDYNYRLIVHADSTTSRSTIDTLLSLLKPLGVIDGFIFSRYNYKLDRIEYEELNN